MEKREKQPTDRQFMPLPVRTSEKNGEITAIPEPLKRPDVRRLTRHA